MAIKFDPNFDKANNSQATQNVIETGENGKKKFSLIALFYWFALVAVIVMGLHAIAPIAVVFIFVLLGLFWILVVLAPTVFTLGIVWISDEYRDFVSGLNDNMGKVFNGDSTDKFLNFIYQSYWYVLFIGGAIILIGLVSSIIDYNSGEDHNPTKKRRMIGLIVFASLFIVAAIVAGLFAANS